MARSLVPKRTKSLRRAIGWKVAAKKKGFGYVGVIGARRDTKKDRAAATAAEAAGRKSKKTLFRRTVKYKGREVVTNPANYAHLVEFGRRAVAVSKKKVLADGSMVFGKGVKAVPPRPFMRPAFEQTKGHCESLIAQHLHRCQRQSAFLQNAASNQSTYDAEGYSRATAARRSLGEA